MHKHAYIASRALSVLGHAGTPKDSMKLKQQWFEFIPPSLQTLKLSIWARSRFQHKEGYQWTTSRWEGDEGVHPNPMILPSGIAPSPRQPSGRTTTRGSQFHFTFTGIKFTWVSGTHLAMAPGKVMVYHQAQHRRFPRLSLWPKRLWHGQGARCSPPWAFR